MRFSYRFFITSDNVCLLVVISEVIFHKNGSTMRIIKYYLKACIFQLQNHVYLDIFIQFYRNNYNFLDILCYRVLSPAILIYGYFCLLYCRQLYPPFNYYTYDAVCFSL